jgi:hypothetical protein
MGDSSDAEAAPLRTSVVSLTNGPSIMILGRLGVSSTLVRLSQTRSVSLARLSLGMIPLATTLDIYAGTSPSSVYADYTGDHRRNDVQRGGAQGNVPLSWGDAKSPIPGQVYVTPQATRG